MLPSRAYTQEMNIDYFVANACNFYVRVVKDCKRANHEEICLFFVHRDKFENDTLSKYKNTAINEN